ncbi:MAG: hypothetical protein ABFS18_13455 [Thermodesulfobacteriota bacterium]
MKMTILTLGLAVFLVTAFTTSASACNVGCTPGYWKQSQHYDDWVGYSPDDLVYDVFECGPVGGMTLLTALKTGGGGEYSLTRHAVASLLNAAVWDCFDGGSPQDIIDAYCAAIAGDSDDIESQKYLFEEDNDQNCPLGGSGRALGRNR